MFKQFIKPRTAWLCLPSTLENRDGVIADIHHIYPDLTITYWTPGMTWTPDTVLDFDAVIVPDDGQPLPKGVLAEIWRSRKAKQLIFRYRVRARQAGKFYGVIIRDGSAHLCGHREHLELRQVRNQNAAKKAANIRKNEIAYQRAQERKVAKAEGKVRRAAKKAAKEAGAPLPTPVAMTPPKPKQLAPKPVSVKVVATPMMKLSAGAFSARRKAAGK